MEGYITIEGAEHILNKMKNLLITAEDRVYISCTRNYLLLLVEELDQLIATRKKLVIVTDQPVSLKNARVYVGRTAGAERSGSSADSRYALIGEYGEGSMNTCLYSGQKNFVDTL